MPLTLLVGGARSGKSALAVELVTRRATSGLAGGPVVAVVTGEAHDDEMRDRIARHRADRPAGWQVVEAPRRLAVALAAIDDDALVLLDCLSFWVANLVMDEVDDDEIELEAARAAAWARRRPALVVAVSNEVGSGVVPDHPLGRRFRDVLGRVNASWAEVADAAWLVVAGRALALAPADVVFGPDA